MFADIGLPNAAEHSIKADLFLRIAARIKSKGLTQAKAASLLGLAQPLCQNFCAGILPVTPTTVCLVTSMPWVRKSVSKYRKQKPGKTPGLNWR
ncbi:XRE family transcriptional regulator [Bradyrhizobium sp. 170]|uniref:XRE family transcriptional regulator n=1 Tax=Bradyrhizobium sp. 170 TaxID=2782641 RepID=UPI001FFEE4D8|nr:XRE family transcriptional regulator [Bradyrhizobium sp. 170]UPK03724.1 XRE family transcriptional regulator [Bradyrhizobium sp. 170]